MQLALFTVARTPKPPINYTTGLAGNVKTLYLDLCWLLSVLLFCAGGVGQETQGCLVWVREPEESAVALPSTVAPSECLYLASVSLHFDLTSHVFGSLTLLLIFKIYLIWIGSNAVHFNNICVGMHAMSPCVNGCISNGSTLYGC